MLGVVDYVVIAIVAIAAIVGLAKGFIKILFSFCKGFVSLIGAYLLCTPLAKIVLGFSFAGTINTKILEWVNGKGAVFTEAIPESGAGELVANNLGLPQFITKYVGDLINEGLGDNAIATGTTLGEAVASTLTYYAILIISFIVLLIVIGIVVSILSKVLTKLFDTSILKPINKLLGFALGAAIGVILVCLIFLGMNALSTIVPTIADIINNQIDPTNEAFGVARWLYNNNFINWALDNLVSADKIPW